MEAPMRRVPLAVAVLVAASSCNIERRPTGPETPITQIHVLPDSILLDPSGTWQFGVYGRDRAGDSVPVSVTWSASAGQISSDAVFTADTSEDDVTITAALSASPSLRGTAIVRKNKVVQVILAPSVVSLLPGASQPFGALGVRSRGDTVSIAVNYSATGGTINPGGVYTAGSVPGTYRVIARRRALADTAEVTILSAPVASVTVSPASANLYIGRTVALTAILRDAAGNVLTGRAITWSSSAASVASVSGSGVVTAVAVGSATITATSEGQSGSAVIAVNVAPVASVAVSPSSATLSIGSTAQLGATTRDSAGNVLTGRIITWASNTPGVATVSASGLVNAIAAGSATITATSEGKSGSSVITVTLVPVATVTVTPATATVSIGATRQLSATTQDSAGNSLTGRVVTWSSSAPGVATVSTSGLVTGVAAGSATITATSEGKSGTASITVIVVPVATVAVAPATATLRVGTTRQLTATTKDSAGTTLTGRTVTWSSNATGVATVSASGLVSAVGVGSATITATSEGKSGTAAITVTLVPVATVTVTPATVSLVLPATQQLSAVTKDSAGNTLTGRTVTWSSNATGIATVSPAGLVTAVAVGSATITATSEGKTGSSSITVTDSNPPPPRAGKYVAANGSSGGDGTAARPWDLATALSGAGGRIVPGDTVWVRGGTYNGSFTSSLRGTASAPIVVRAYPGERVTLDGTSSSSITLNVDGQWAVYWGFEIKNTILTRFGSGLAARPSGVYVRNATNVKLVNLIIHDTGHGTYIEETAHNIEIYGWIVYNGGNDNSSRSDGHGIYVRNDGTTPKVIADNVIFNQFGFGLHAYAEGGDRLNAMTFEGNILFNNGELSAFDSPNMILGGETSATNDTVRNNIMYFSPGRGPRNMRLGYTTSFTNGSGVFEGNYLVGGATSSVDITLWQNLRFRNNTIVQTGRVLAFADQNTAAYTWTGNTHYRDPAARAWGYRGSDLTFADWTQTTGLSASDQVFPATPTVPVIVVRANKYERGRGNIAVINWGRQASVLVDLSAVLAVGQRFEIRNVQDFWGTPVVSGVFGGGSVSIPMNGVAPPQPVGGSPTAPIRTGPDFDVFVVVPVP
jgi:uncharacterized protein YjdB